MLAIYKRDLRAYFSSPLGYVFIAAFLIVTNLVFLLTNLLTGSNAIGTVYTVILYILMVIVPILTMRTFSEDYKQRTDQPGKGRHGNRADVRQRDPRRFQRLARDRADRLDMGAAGDLGHHAAVKSVRFHLGSHDIGKDLQFPVLGAQNRAGGLVTGAFHA